MRDGLRRNRLGRQVGEGVRALAGEGLGKVLVLEAAAEDRHEVEVRRVEVGLELGGALEWVEEEVEASREGQRELDDTLSYP